MGRHVERGMGISYDETLVSVTEQSCQRQYVIRDLRIKGKTFKTVCDDRRIDLMSLATRRKAAGRREVQYLTCDPSTAATWLERVPLPSLIDLFPVVWHQDAVLALTRSEKLHTN